VATYVVISGFGFRDIYLPVQSDFRNIAVCTVEMFYRQYMGVAVVISFVPALETEIPLGLILLPPRWLPTGVKKGVHMRVKASYSKTF